MYSDKVFHVRPLQDVFEDIDHAARLFPDTRRVFVCDGAALNGGYDGFSAVCRRFNERFPKLSRIAAYVNARDILGLSPQQLEDLRGLRFTLGYLGLESGSARVLDMVHKGATPEEMVAANEKARQARIKLSVIGLLGVGGRELSGEHATETAHILNQMQPQRLAFLTTIILPGTPLHAWTQEGEFVPLTDKQTLQELRSIVEGLQLKSTIFRANHRSNLLGLAGDFPKDKAALLLQIDDAIAVAEDEVTCVWTASEGRFL
jgi:hypothetical protein